MEPMGRVLAATLLVAISLLASGKTLPEGRVRARCFQLADWTLQAGEAMRAGKALAPHLAEGEDTDSARREAAEAVYRDRPRDLSDYIESRLGACLRAGGAALGARAAKACYDRTLWAGTLFTSRRQGVPLERLLEGYARAGMPLAELAEAVYRTEKSEPDFRRDLFLDCTAD